MKCECGGALRFTHCITGHEVWSCAFCGRETLIEEDSGPTSPDRCISRDIKMCEEEEYNGMNEDGRPLDGR